MADYPGQPVPGVLTGFYACPDGHGLHDITVVGGPVELAMVAKGLVPNGELIDLGEHQIAFKDEETGSYLTMKPAHAASQVLHAMYGQEPS